MTSLQLSHGLCPVVWGEDPLLLGGIVSFNEKDMRNDGPPERCGRCGSATVLKPAHPVPFCPFCEPVSLPTDEMMATQHNWVSTPSTAPSQPVVVFVVDGCTQASSFILISQLLEESLSALAEVRFTFSLNFPRLELALRADCGRWVGCHLSSRHTCVRAWSSRPHLLSMFSHW